MHHPAPCDLKHAPALATLAILDTALLCCIATLDAAHDEVHVQAWNPDAPEAVRLAAAISQSAAALRGLLEQYESVTISHLANDIPW